MPSIDLNCDLGESFGVYRFENDEALLAQITSANVACGFHAGDPSVMMRTVDIATLGGVAVGAHPSYPDRQGFGRRQMEMTADEIYSHVLYQIGAVAGFLQASQTRLHHVKPHGALYNVAATNEQVAQAIVSAVADFDSGLQLYAPFHSRLAACGAVAGLSVVYEVFADRRYEADGTLTPRSEPGALIDDEDEACRQVLQMVEHGVVTTRNGDRLAIQADTVCVHGDGANPVGFVQRLRASFTQAGIEIRRPSAHR